MDRFFKYKLDHILFWTFTVFFHGYTRIALIDKVGVGQFIIELILRNGLLAIVIYSILLLVIPRLTHGKILSATLTLLAAFAFYVGMMNAYDMYLYGFILHNAKHANFFSTTFSWFSWNA